MAYIVKKPMNLAGKRRIIGEVLSDEEINLTRVYSLVQSGYLAEVGNMSESVHNFDTIKERMNVTQKSEGMSMINVPIKQGNDSFELELTAEDVVQVFEMLQETVEVATERIKEIEKEEVLILIDATDNRKGVKASAVEQAKKIKERISFEQEGGHE